MSFFCFSPKQIYVVLNFITQSQFHIEIKRKKKKEIVVTTSRLLYRSSTWGYLHTHVYTPANTPPRGCWLHAAWGKFKSPLFPQAPVYPVTFPAHSVARSVKS